VDAAVARARNRNLLVSSTVLLLLGVSFGLMVVATRRAQRLAAQQVEFVAGVTHELRTPLAVIRSAGENLADGVVAEPLPARTGGDWIGMRAAAPYRHGRAGAAYAGLETGKAPRMPHRVAGRTWRTKRSTPAWRLQRAGITSR
jgi:signal transduction histidine kinase